MSRFVLKTANRKTIVSRAKVREAVAAVYAPTSPAAKSKNDPAVSIAKNPKKK